jgi:hypothetical protein
MANQTEQLSALRKPFPEHQISYLPKGGVKLAYVGHAALTDRLLDVDPTWTWEPLAMTPEGLPLADKVGGMWIKLTVCGVTRLGYGHAAAKTGGDAVKEIIGDALRNAAMRFGAALDLWHKGELHIAELDNGTEPEAPTTITAQQAAVIKSMMQETESDTKAFLAWVSKGAGVTVSNVDAMPASAYVPALERLKSKKKTNKALQQVADESQHQ